MRACGVLAEVSVYVCDSAYKLSGIVLKVSKKPEDVLFQKLEEVDASPFEILSGEWRSSDI